MADKPFPASEVEVNLLLQTLAINLPLLAGVLGISGADVDFVVKNAVNYQYVLTVALNISDQREAFTAFKTSLFKGDPIAPAPDPPVFPAISLPSPAQNGIETELRAIIRRIKASPAYNETIGEQLGLVETGQSGFNSDDLVAALKVTAKPGGVVEIVFSKQGQDAIRVDWMRKGDTSWRFGDIYTTSPGSHSEPSAPPEDPESRQYRGILLKKNVAVGNYSPIYTIVTTP